MIDGDQIFLLSHLWSPQEYLRYSIDLMKMEIKLGRPRAIKRNGIRHEKNVDCDPDSEI